MIIYKYPIEKFNEWFTLAIPNSRFLSAQEQPTYTGGSEIQMWLQVHNEANWEIKDVHLIAVGTGIPFREVAMTGSEIYLGTVQKNPFVWHLYTRKLPYEGWIK